MPNNKFILIMGVVVLLTGGAAFIVGRMFNSGVNPIASDGPLGAGPGFTVSSSNNITPAPELPTTPPEATGLYLERKDHTMIIQAVSFDPGIGEVAGDSSVDVDSAPKVEILLTARTTIYRDTIQLNQSASSENFTIHQTVEESTLNNVAPPTMITVWGRKSGDRVIATVLLFSNSLNIQKP